MIPNIIFVVFSSYVWLSYFIHLPIDRIKQLFNLLNSRVNAAVSIMRLRITWFVKWFVTMLKWGMMHNFNEYCYHGYRPCVSNMYLS